MRLAQITFLSAPPCPGLRPGNLISINCDDPPVPLRGWILHVRTAFVYLVSPPGWRVGVNEDQWDPKGERRMFEISRPSVVLSWGGDVPELEGVAKFTSEPFGKKS